jgi:outer membrane protein OmpA-like peptidoglycan-associated protein
VRVEIASALRRGIAVAPVLLDDAAFPAEQDLPDDLKPLARRNGVELRRLTFDADVERLTRGLGLQPQRVSRERRLSGVAVWVALAVVLFGGMGAGLWFAAPLGWRTPAASEPANVSEAATGDSTASSDPVTQAFVPPAAGVTQAAGVCGDVDALIYFDFDRSDLSAEGRSTLEEALTKTFDCIVDRVVIEAHEDIGGSEAYAMAVSERRANAVAQVFSSAGVEGGAIYQQAFGHSRPWQPHVRSPANRRVHVKLELMPPPPAQ